ncbi:hypothetical protein BY458DRAFT_500586 [Sporodiniella umbellata]|nr:hypothetical protein BY458DRAFT_500586 [Sporodiniella umbellata]
MDAEDSDDLEAYVYRDKPKYWNMEPDHHYYHAYYQQPHYSHYSSTDTEGCEPSYISPYGDNLSSRRPVLRSMLSVQEINSRKAGMIYNTFYTAHPNQSGDEDYHRRRRKKSSGYTRNQRSWVPCLYIVCAVVLAFCVLWIVIAMCASPLVEVEVTGISNVLGTQKELMFNLHVHARNSNWWMITMTTASFSVFASSHYVPTSLENKTYYGADPAEFLGTIYHLEDPLIYPAGSLLNTTDSIATSQIRIKSPGSIKDDNSGNERWSLLIRYPYELTVRGVLKYQMIPFPLSFSPLHTVRVCKMASVDPSTGQITDDATIPEKSICDDPSPIEGSKY